MMLEEANALLASVDCADPHAVEAALNERARAIAEFAASASAAVLSATHAAGETFRERLEQSRIETRRDLERMTKLSRGLQATLEEHRGVAVASFG